MMFESLIAILAVTVALFVLCGVVGKIVLG